MENIVRPICAVVLLLAAGCASGPALKIDPEGPLCMPDKGKVPVLKVAVEFERHSWAGRPGWGGMSKTDPARSFARLVSAAAEKTGAATVPLPREVKKQLRETGTDYSLQPDDAQLRKYVAALKPPAYLTVRLRGWQQNFYTGIFQDSTVLFTLACRQPGKKKPLWTATVSETADYTSPRELALRELEKVFKKVSARKEAAKQ
jgi:hypothetical protein